MKHYGNKIKELRKKAGKTQTDMESLTGIPQTSISRFESEEFSNLEYIIKALEKISPRVTPGQFFSDDDSVDMVFRQKVLNELLDSLMDMPEHKRVKALGGLAALVSSLK